MKQRRNLRRSTSLLEEAVVGAMRAFTLGILVLMLPLIGCSKNSLGDTPVDETDRELEAYEQSITRLDTPVRIRLMVNNSISEESLRASYPGYTPEELANPTINTNTHDRVQTITISELRPQDYEITKGGQPAMALDNTSKVKYIDRNAREVELSLKALPKANSGQLTIYANVLSPVDMRPFIKGSSGDTRELISNENRIVDYLAKATASNGNNIENRIVDAAYNYGTVPHVTHPHYVFEQPNDYLLPMSVRYYNTSGSGSGDLYASYSKDEDPERIDIIFLKRAYALLEVHLDNTSYEGEAQNKRWEYRNFVFYNYPNYLSYLDGDYANVKAASGFQVIDRGLVLNPERPGSDASAVTLSSGTFDFKKKVAPFYDLRGSYDNMSSKFVLRLLVPEYDPETAEKQFRLLLSSKIESGAGEIMDNRFTLYSIAIGVRSGKYLKIFRNEKYVLKVRTYKNGVEVGYEVKPFVDHQVDVAPFE